MENTDNIAHAFHADVNPQEPTNTLGFNTAQLAIDTAVTSTESSNSPSSGNALSCSIPDATGHWTSMTGRAVWSCSVPEPTGHRWASMARRVSWQAVLDCEEDARLRELVQRRLWKDAVQRGIDPVDGTWSHPLRHPLCEGTGKFDLADIYQKGDENIKYGWQVPTHVAPASRCGVDIGVGRFASRKIMKGEVVWVGREGKNIHVMRDENDMRDLDNEQGHEMLTHFAFSFVVNGEPSVCITVPHACLNDCRNTPKETATVRDISLGGCDLVTIALEDIEEGEELHLDFSDWVEVPWYEAWARAKGVPIPREQPWANDESNEE